jgi:hypothetical protein
MGVADADLVGVTPQVFNFLTGSEEGLLDIDHPGLLKHLVGQ